MICWEDSYLIFPPTYCQVADGPGGFLLSAKVTLKKKKDAFKSEQRILPICSPKVIIHDPLHTVFIEWWIRTLSSRWMIMGTSLASMTACTCCWLPAVMLDRNHTASYRTKSPKYRSVTVSYCMESSHGDLSLCRFSPNQRSQKIFTVTPSTREEELAR